MAAKLIDAVPDAGDTTGRIPVEDSSHLAFVEERTRYLSVVDDFLTRVDAAARQD